MSDQFQGWPEEGQRFFIGLQLDNSKAYFEANKATYLRCVRAPMEALMASVQDEFGPGKIFRPNRDIRFTADKSPYKTEISATCPGGYVSFSARGLFSAAGWWHVEKPALERFRAAVADERSGSELAEMVAGLESDGYEIGGDELKVVPKPYPRDHLREQLLRRKQLMVMKSYGLQPWLGTPEAHDRVVAVWRAAQPFMAWLKANVG